MDAPAVRRVSFDDSTRRAAAGIVPDDPDKAGQVARSASQLAPLHAIQVAFDQLQAVGAARRRGEPWPHGGTYGDHYADVMEHARRHADTLAVAAEAADAMIEDMEGQLKRLEDHMADEHARMTDDGAPHPLEAGGYDPAADPQLPSNVSDVAALKQGKTTRRQAEAIARADADAAGTREGAKAERADADADADAGAKGPAKAPILTPRPPQAASAPPTPPKPEKR